MPLRSKSFPGTYPEVQRSQEPREALVAAFSPSTALIEIAGAYLLIEAAEWTENATKLIWSLIAAVWILICVFRRRPSARELGLTAPSLPSVVVTVGSAAVLAFVILVGGWMAGTWDPRHPTWPPMQNADLYAIWALLQQFMLQIFFYVRLESVLRNSRWAVATTALLFAAAHIPNPFLMLGTLAGGLFFCEFFRRGRNLWPLAAAHALLGYALAESLSMVLMRHMRVGIGYVHLR